MKKLKRYRKAAISQKNYVGLFAFFFVLGIFWGKFFYYSEENREVLFKKPTLNLLAEESFLPSDITETFALENDVDLAITNYKNKAELTEYLKDAKFDLIAFKSYYVQEVIKNLASLAATHLENVESISVDFRNPPYDPENKYAIPLFWGIDKNAQSEKSFLWIESIGVTKNSDLKEYAYEFLDYILQSDVALEAIRHRKVASTNKSIEKAKNIDSNLKPSFLRKISIRDLAFADRAGF